jgi:hypothetical protein
MRWFNHGFAKYLVNQMESLHYCPNPKDTKYVSYAVKNEGNVYRLVKRYKQVYRGYVYNSSERTETILCTVRYLEFDGDNIPFDGISSNLWNDLNTEINHRVLKEMDRDSLYQLFGDLQSRLKCKSNWTTPEFTSLLSETLKSFHKELFSNIAKRMRRYGKRHSAYKRMLPQVDDNKKRD